MRSEKEMLELLNKYLNDARDILDSLGIEYNEVTEIKLCNRFNTWGYTLQYPDDTYTIEISPLLLEEEISYEATMNTVIHELLHCHKDRFEHRGEWKRCAQLVNENYKQFLVKTGSTNKENGVKKCDPNTKYNVVCLDCGTIDSYQRKSKCVRDLLAGHKGWRCGNCKSTNLEVEFYNGRKE